MLVKECFVVIAIISVTSGHYYEVPEVKRVARKPRVIRATIAARQQQCTNIVDCPLDKICLNQKCVGGYNTKCQLVNDNVVCKCIEGFVGDPYSQCFSIKPFEKPDTSPNKQPISTDKQTEKPNTQAVKPNTPTVKPNTPTASLAKPVLFPSNVPQSLECELSKTVVNGEQVCKGRLIFEEKFDELDTTIWEHDVRIANSPDFEFVAYTGHPNNSFVKNGILHVKPILTSELYGKDMIKRGNLVLQGCTGIPNSIECSKQADSWDIVPPILSSRLRTRRRFTFCYGRVEIRAKFPSGDWIYPEIWLDPKYDWYGKEYKSGRIQIAMARGNRELYKQDQPQHHIGERLLEAGCILGVDENVTIVQRSKENSDSGWSRDFHIYSLEWTPDNLIFLVDGVNVGVISPPPGGFGDLPFFKGNRDILWTDGSNLAPFDKEFYLTLGLGVGGIRHFPDNCNTVLPQREVHRKPWKNTEPKFMLKFWRDQSNWQQTWTDESSLLQVDYVKVWSL